MNSQMVTKFLVIFTVITCEIKLDVHAIQLCSTPRSWLNNAIRAQFPSTGQSNYFGKFSYPGMKWPGGIVKYKLNSTLGQRDREQVMLAIDEFHQKTCIKFQRWTEGDGPRFVSIERDDSVCGLANVCMSPTSTGYQFARFGAHCRNKAAMVHELGHTLCLGHEQLRPDRDNFLSFDKCSASETPKRFRASNIHYGIYDFDSQMHYTCGCCGGGYPKPQFDGGFGCGSQVQNGLSILDADRINALYDCEECYRHRWISVENFASGDRENLPNFNTGNSAKRPLYPCRAAIGRQMLVGMFDQVAMACFVPMEEDSLRLKMISSYFEILTIAGGLRFENNKYGERSGKTEYQLENYFDLTHHDFSKGIISGKLFNSKSSFQLGFIGLIQVNVEKIIDERVQVICETQLKKKVIGETDFFNGMTEKEKLQFKLELETGKKETKTFGAAAIKLATFLIPGLSFNLEKSKLLKEKCAAKFRVMLEREWADYREENATLIYTVPAGHSCVDAPYTSKTLTGQSTKDVRICSSKVLVCH